MIQHPTSRYMSTGIKIRLLKEISALSCSLKLIHDSQDAKTTRMCTEGAWIREV